MFTKAERSLGAENFSTGREELVALRGKNIALGGKNGCTSREETLHFKGRIVAPEGKKCTINALSQLEFLNAQHI
jgi:hypothetical protein